MTLSSYTELFIFKVHSKHELIKFHCSTGKKIRKYYHHHVWLEEPRMRQRQAGTDPQRPMRRLGRWLP